MPPLSEATKRPDLSNMEMVAVNSAPPAAPVMAPREQPGLAPGSLGPAPSVFTTDYDRVRQWMRPGTSQNRMPPLPTKANPSINASILSQKGTTAAADIDVVVTDGLVHPSSPPPWWCDPSFFYFVDDFNNWEGSGAFTDTITTAKGQVSKGWAFFGNNAPTGNLAARLIGGSPQAPGQFTQANSANANQYAGLALNHVGGSVSHYEQSWALLENPGWIASWIFKVAGEPLINATVSSDTLTASNKKAFYIGLAGASTSSIFSGSFLGARPNVFIGLRYDTSRMPPSMQITAVGNASAGSTAYTGTFGSPLWNGQNITVTGCTNPLNNGTFLCTAANSTTLTLSNANGVAETTVSANAVANPASLPLTSVATASGGTTVYTFTAPPAGPTANQLVGATIVIAGFSTSANNGTFTCVANTTTTLTLNNAAGVSETHAATATGGTIGDAFWTFEAVVNRQFNPPANVMTQGQTLVTNTPLNTPGFHRLDILCTTAGKVTLTLDGNQNVTFIIPTITIGSSGSGTFRSTGQTATVQPTVGGSGLNANASYPPFAAGSQVTWAGFSGAWAGLNGTVFLDSQFDNSGSPVMYFPTSNNGGQQTTPGFTATGFPAFAPVFIWGNDNSAAPPTCFRMYVDFFGICWGHGLSTSGASGATPTATNPRY